MSQNNNTLGWLQVAGTPFEIGAAIGAQGRDAVHAHLLHSDIWAMATSAQYADTVARMSENTKAQFPEFFEEMRGLAEGLQVPFQDVFAWNCRGDLLASVPDGCTTLQTPAQALGGKIHLSHNEDGSPFFRGHCFILDAHPHASPAYNAFCYPGSLPGHTFGWNEVGLVQTVNNLRLQNVAPTIPRMVLGRAVLASRTLQDAVRALTQNPESGGFHMTLAQAGQNDLISVEYGGGRSSVATITKAQGHTNHALHMPAPGQITTQSSLDRQATLERLLAGGSTSHLDFLRHTSGPGLPIRRDAPDDPDEENTLATCLFTVSKTDVDWRIYGDKDGPAVYHGTAKIA